MIQIITPNPNIPCKPGWCLQYVRQTFNLPAAYPTATAAWLASTSKHRDRQFPKGVWLPVWFSLANEPAGHVALMAPDGSVYSTSDLSNKPHHHLDLSDLMNYYVRYGMKLTYLGWTEDVAGYPVIGPAGIAAQGTTTSTQASEEDELNKDQNDALGAIFNRVNPVAEAGLIASQGDINILREDLRALREVLVGTIAKDDEATRANVNLLLQLVTAMDASLRYVKAPEDDTLYELDAGKLRGITRSEWELRGGRKPVEVDPKLIADLLKAA